MKECIENWLYKRIIFSPHSLARRFVLRIWGRESGYFDILSLLQNEVQAGVQNFELQEAAIESVQRKLSERDGFYAPLLGWLICILYPNDFEISKCPCCNSNKWNFDYIGKKTLPAKLYPGLPEFPIYARETLPLIYGHCRHCGLGKILVTPKSFWIDAPIQPAGQYGQWMDEASYIQEKISHTHTHYRRSQLSRFQSDAASVMECSPGNGIFMKTLRDDYGWKTLLGVEPDPTAAISAQSKYRLSMVNDYIYRVRNQSNFDLVVFDNSLEHHSNPAFALAVARDCLRIDGGLFIIVPNYHSYAVETLGIEYFNMNWGHWSYFTMQSLCQMVTKANFQVLEGYCTFFEPSIGKAFPTMPPNVDREMSGEQIAELPIHEKAFRGEFLYLVAKKIKEPSVPQEDSPE